MFVFHEKPHSFSPMTLSLIALQEFRTLVHIIERELQNVATLQTKPLNDFYVPRVCSRARILEQPHHAICHYISQWTTI
jgi:hypothetical protein